MFSSLNGDKFKGDKLFDYRKKKSDLHLLN